MHYNVLRVSIEFSLACSSHDLHAYTGLSLHRCVIAVLQGRARGTRHCHWAWQAAVHAWHSGWGHSFTPLSLFAGLWSRGCLLLQELPFPLSALPDLCSGPSGNRHVRLVPCTVLCCWVCLSHNMCRHLSVVVGVRAGKDGEGTC